MINSSTHTLFPFSGLKSAKSATICLKTVYNQGLLICIRQYQKNMNFRTNIFFSTIFQFSPTVFPCLFYLFLSSFRMLAWGWVYGNICVLYILYYKGSLYYYIVWSKNKIKYFLSDILVSKWRPTISVLKSHIIKLMMHLRNQSVKLPKFKKYVCQIMYKH